VDRSIPAPAAHLLQFIYRTETGRDAPDCYLVVYGQRQAELPKPLTEMTFDEVVKGGPARSRKFGSSAAGAAQFMRDTLDQASTAADLKGQMGLDGDELFSPDLQDRMAYHLLKRRGLDKFLAGSIGVVAFGKALAQEWASFPVLAATQGAHRKVARGETYYAGDRLNKALVPPERIEEILREVKAMKGAPEPEQIENRPEVGDAITDKNTVSQVQARLFELGYTEVGSRKKDGSFDGGLGDMTRAAILAFRNDNGLPVVDYVDQALLLALLQAKPRQLSPARVEAKPADVRQQVPEAKAAWWTQVGAWVLGIPATLGAAASGVIDNLDGSRGYLEPVKQFAGDIPPWLWFVGVALVALFIWWRSHQAQAASTIAYQTGERR
jgi:muramidase (phage lysozyme)